MICKEGFNLEFLAEDVRVRQSCPELPTPKILEVADDGTWYSEELILGTPINRLKDQTQADRAVEAILPPLFQLYESTLETMLVRDYVSAIVSKIQRLTSNNRLIPLGKRKELVEQVQELSNLSSDSELKIVTVQSHGDFQPANILAGEKSPWLIDWEYTARRQVGYDGLVFALSSRHPAGLSGRIQQSLCGDGVSNLLQSWPHSKWDDKNYRRMSLVLFLLEDLELKLTEINNPLFKSLDVGFSRFFEELKSSVAVLKESVT